MEQTGRTSPDPRTDLVARWFALTREVLPGMAARNGWPIHEDHCFMRVCLDVSLGAPWPSVVRAPAYLTMSDAQLAAAVTVAEGIAAAPDTLPTLNERSLRARAAWRARGSPKAS